MKQMHFISARPLGPFSKGQKFQKWDLDFIQLEKKERKKQGNVRVKSEGILTDESYPVIAVTE